MSAVKRDKDYVSFSIGLKTSIVRSVVACGSTLFTEVIISPFERFLVNSSKAPEISCSNGVFRLFTGGRLNSIVAMPVLSSTAKLINRLHRCDDTENILIDIVRTPCDATLLINILSEQKQKKENFRFIQMTRVKVEIIDM